MFKEHVNFIQMNNLSLDIESSEQISLQQFEEEAELIHDEHSHYINEAEKLKQRYIQSYQEEVNKISEDFKGEASKLLHEGKILCRKMAEAQRREVEELEAEWREARELQIAQENETYNSRMTTAKILANYECFDTAKSIKTIIQKETRERSPALKTIDSLYLKQYKLMSQRHEKDFVLLFERVRAKVQSSKKDAEFLKKKADADKICRDAEIPVVIMDFVTRQTKQEETKKLVMQSFSPRNKK